MKNTIIGFLILFILVVSPAVAAYLVGKNNGIEEVREKIVQRGYAYWVDDEDEKHRVFVWKRSK